MPVTTGTAQQQLSVNQHHCVLGLGQRYQATVQSWLLHGWDPGRLVCSIVPCCAGGCATDSTMDNRACLLWGSGNGMQVLLQHCESSTDPNSAG